MLSSPTAVKVLYRFWRIQCPSRRSYYVKKKHCALFTRLPELPFDSHYIFLNANSNNFLQSIRTIVCEKQAVYEGAYISESDSARTAKHLPDLDVDFALYKPLHIPA